MNIRKMLDSEFSYIENIYNQTKLDELQYEEKAFQLLPIKQDNKRLTGLIESDIYVYTKAEEILGFGAIHHSTDKQTSEIRVLQVHPHYRGKGIGTLLLNFLLHHPQTHSTVALHVVHTNHPAKSLYNKYNFNIVETFATTYNNQHVMADKMERCSEKFTEQP